MFLRSWRCAEESDGRQPRPAGGANGVSSSSLRCSPALSAWTHYYCVLLIPLTLYIGGKIAVPDRPAWAAAIAAAGLIVSLPVVLPRPTYAPVVVLTERVLRRTMSAARSRCWESC